MIGVTILAVVLGWWQSEIRRQRNATAWVLAQGGYISYDYERPLADGSYPLGAKPPGPDWLRNWLGIDYFARVEGVILDRDEVKDLAPLADLPYLRFVGLMIEVDPQLDFSPLYHHQRLKTVYLDYTGLQPEQLAAFREAQPDCRIKSATDPKLSYTPD